MKDGGTAFPVYSESRFGECMDCENPGLTIRDYFAGQALAGLASLTPPYVKDSAGLAYEYADAMLAEREKIPAGVKNEL